MGHPALIGGLASSVIGAGQDQKQWEDFIKRYDRQYADTLGAARDTGDSTKRDYNAYAGESRKMYGDMTDELYKDYAGRTDQMVGEARKLGDTQVGAVAGDFAPTLAYGQKRYGDVLGMLDTAGDQEKKDINRQFDSLQSKAGADLVGRGLSASTVAPTVAASIDRERAGAQGNLNTRLREQKAGYASSLSGDVLDTLAARTAATSQTRQKYGDYVSSIFNERTAGAGDLYKERKQGVQDLFDQLSTGGIALDQETANRLISVLGNREQIAPQQSALTTIGGGLMGLRASNAAAQATERAGRRSMWGSIFGGAGQAAGGAMTGAGYAGGFSKLFA